MKKHLSRLLLPAMLALPRMVAAQDTPPSETSGGGFGAAQEKLGTAGKIAFGESATQRGLEEVIGDIVAPFLGLLGVIFLGLAIYGGYLWMMARGNEQQIEKAKTLLTSAVIGLVIIGAGYAITDFVLRSVTTATTGEA